jgi:phosphoribosylaminoimidazole carboxylase PurE protein
MKYLSIILGSTSDYEVLKSSGAFELLDKCSVGPGMRDVTVASVHRNPKPLEAHCLDMISNHGIHIFMAGAGWNAGLAGGVASFVGNLGVVIGVPLSSSVFRGKDALMAMISMPKDTPVLVMNLDGPGFYNGALTACRMLAQTHAEIQHALSSFTLANAKPPVYGQNAIEEALAKGKRKEA